MGLGGGTLLIAIAPIYLPGSAVVPIHGIVQLASNSSRMLFSLKAVAWSLVGRFIVGSLVFMIAGAIADSWLGTLLRGKINFELFAKLHTDRVGN